MWGSVVHEFAATTHEGTIEGVPRGLSALGPGNLVLGIRHLINFTAIVGITIIGK